MVEIDRKLTSVQLDELKRALKRMGLDRNKSAQFLTPKLQFESYETFVLSKPSADSVKPVASQSLDSSPNVNVKILQSVYKLGQKNAAKPGRGPGRKPKRIPYSLLLDEELLDTYNRLSVEQERPVSELMRLALRRAIQQPTNTAGA